MKKHRALGIMAGSAVGTAVAAPDIRLVEAAKNQNAVHAIAAIRSRTGARYSPQRERRFGAIITLVIPAPLMSNSGNKAVIASPIKLTHFHGRGILLAMLPQWRH